MVVSRNHHLYHHHHKRKDMRTLKRLLTESGMSLVEMMVGVGLLGGASLALMNVEKLSSSVKRTSLYAVDSARTIKGISTILNDGTSCAATFGGKKPAGAGETRRYGGQKLKSL